MQEVVKEVVGPAPKPYNTQAAAIGSLCELEQRIEGCYTDLGVLLSRCALTENILEDKATLNRVEGSMNPTRQGDGTFGRFEWAQAAEGGTAAADVSTRLKVCWYQSSERTLV